MKILVSSCLIGKKCAYDGKARAIAGIDKFLNKYSFIDICPEIEGGLTCPRDKHEILGGDGEDVLSGRARVVSEKGRDDTENFIKGALKALELAEINNVSVALLKSKSPSCGKYEIYNGSFSGKSLKGSGVTARLLDKNQIKIYTEKELDKINDVCLPEA